MYIRIIKPFFDFFTASLLIIILLPIIIILCFLLAIANGGTPFFTQLRPGKNEKIFRLIKFKTMTDKKDQNGELLSDYERLTYVGKLVRKASLDELPQLFNILKGDMSFIGPRPLLIEYLPFYTEIQKKRHLVKPGISGLAQVKGRNFLLFSKRLKLDLIYVKNISLKLDIYILFHTINTIFFKTKTVSTTLTVDQVDDIGLSKNLQNHHFKKFTKS